MATLTFFLDTRRTNTKGEHLINIRLQHKNEHVLISLKHSISKNYWIGNDISRPVNGKYPNAALLNNKLEAIKATLTQKLFEIERDNFYSIQLITAKELKNMLLQKNKQQTTTTFNDLYNNFIERCRTESTKNMYKHTYSQLMKFLGDKDINFKDITVPFLRQFDEHLERNGASINTRSIHLRNIRTLYNRAIEAKIVKIDEYPFRQFKIRSEQREKDCLTPEQVYLLYTYNFKTKGQQLARDFWMLSFFLCGINPIDLYMLKKPDQHNKITYTRTKTQHASNDDVHILIQPEAQDIINKYKTDDDEYLLNFSNKYMSYDIFRHFISKCIRQIADILDMRGLTLYWARYSWATIADNLDISEKVISKALGHKDTSMAGRKYIAFDWNKVDKANREIIDCIINQNKNNVKN